ncbi:TPA: type 1 fimbrial major subunit FimA [Providencia rettgeri]|uniref:type 1 fimbrial major subunit FimA n=1 Tax=Providencia rettgeri TaxID=587 RepID=UPI0005B2FC69|nr:type 1 fimbrial major subunit FimA [Providencia rettgeri]EJD6672737.1 type 1 fimbrial major subunit FimA [Providencia rettgeri]HEM7509590.1 type 1 fimbrial major subunit FimA [Providencia rettgeri]HEM8269620.1 type 1 fimbrial major subunit FimA [Providencia rettgeri]
MFNKSVVLKSAVCAALFSVSALASAVTVPGGTIHFKGSIVNAACAVSASSDGQVVKLGQYRSANFTAAGDRSNPVTFQIELEDCDTTVSKTAQVAFSGNLDAIDSTVLAVTNSASGTSGAASGVGIEIADHTGLVLKPDGSAFSTAQNLINGHNVLNFSARYKSTVAAVTPGAADASATFVMQYM